MFASYDIWIAFDSVIANAKGYGNKIRIVLHLFDSPDANAFRTFD
jgi:hypothetical protein